MDGNNEVFFNTHTIIELVKGNLKYYAFKEVRMVTTGLNLMELYCAVLSELGEVKAKEVYFSFKLSQVEVSDEAVFEAMKFRLEKKVELFIRRCGRVHCCKEK